MIVIDCLVSILLVVFSDLNLLYRSCMNYFKIFNDFFIIYCWLVTSSCIFGIWRFRPSFFVYIFYPPFSRRNTLTLGAIHLSLFYHQLVFIRK